MVAGVLASAIESVGDYYACARLAGTSHMQFIMIYYTGWFFLLVRPKMTKCQTLRNVERLTLF